MNKPTTMNSTNNTNAVMTALESDIVGGIHGVFAQRSILQPYRRILETIRKYHEAHKDYKGNSIEADSFYKEAVESLNQLSAATDAASAVVYALMPAIDDPARRALAEELAEEIQTVALQGYDLLNCLQAARFTPTPTHTPS